MKCRRKDLDKSCTVRESMGRQWCVQARVFDIFVLFYFMSQKICYERFQTMGHIDLLVSQRGLEVPSASLQRLTVMLREIKW